MKLYPYPLNFGSELVFIPQIFPKFNQSSNIIPYKPSLVNYTACTSRNHIAFKHLSAVEITLSHSIRELCCHRRTRWTRRCNDFARMCVPWWGRARRYARFCSLLQSGRAASPKFLTTTTERRGIRHKQHPQCYHFFNIDNAKAIHISKLPR